VLDSPVRSLLMFFVFVLFSSSSAFGQLLSEDGLDLDGPPPEDPLFCWEDRRISCNGLLEPSGCKPEMSATLGRVVCSSSIEPVADSEIFTVVLSLEGRKSFKRSVLGQPCGIKYFCRHSLDDSGNDVCTRTGVIDDFARVPTWFADTDSDRCRSSILPPEPEFDDDAELF